MASPRFDPELIRRACSEGDRQAIANLSLTIHSALRARPTTHPGTHGIPDSEASNFAYRMLRACERNGQVPQELVDLLQVILKQDRPPRRGHGLRKLTARQAALEYKQKHRNASLREIAKAHNVNVSTVSRWNRSGKLKP
jgi:hypothetical protein